MPPSIELPSLNADKATNPTGPDRDQGEREGEDGHPEAGKEVVQGVAANAPDEAQTPSPDRNSNYITGWRLYVLMFGLLLAQFLAALETTIVSTSLVSISNALDGFDQRNWIVTSYLLTYTGFLVIYAKFSDVLGRKIVVLIATAIFTIASIACGFANTMNQLIVLRAFQGLGGSGINALVTIINPELVPTKHWGNIVALVALTMILSSSLGPVLGGLITENTTWRWVFLCNAPPGAFASIIIYILLPANFPNQGLEDQPARLGAQLTRQSLKRLDFIGAFLLLGSSVLIVFAFEEAGLRYAWDSAVILSTLIVGVLLFGAFLAFEYLIRRPKYPQEPVFPLRLVKSRMFVGLVIIGFCTGPPFWTALINLPQRFQAINGFSPFQAGTHLLPMMLAAPVGTALAGQLATRFHTPPFYVMVAGSTLLIIGMGLLSWLQEVNEMLGVEALFGFGLGITMCVVLLYIPFVIERKDLAVTLGVFTQVRVLGGTIGVAISAAIMNNQLSSRLPSIISSQELGSVLSSTGAIEALPESVREVVRGVFRDAFTLQFQTTLAFCGTIILAIGLLWEWPLRRARDMADF